MGHIEEAISARLSSIETQVILEFWAASKKMTWLMELSKDATTARLPTAESQCIL